MKIRITTIIIALVVFCSGLFAQDFIELRAGFTKDGLAYRYIDYNHTFSNNVVFDIAHYGSSGQNELWIGAGYSKKLGESFVTTNAAYLVVGKENRQIGLGLASFGGGKIKKTNITYQTYAFLPARGDMAKYLAVDSFDLTIGVTKKIEIGGSLGAYFIGKNSNLLGGGLVRFNDKLGSTSFYLRGGAYTEFRVSRTISFN